MNPFWIIRKGRLELRPPTFDDLLELSALKADARVFAVMLGGVRSAVQARDDLADDIRHWGAHGYGTWVVHLLEGGPMLGLVALRERPDGRGIGLRFAFWPHVHGRGIAAEAAAAALRYGHTKAGLRRIVAVARATNFPSRELIGSIGMRLADTFEREGWEMLLFESVSGAG
ncbi:MAG TPA: GNAT family N-acetyltransferase [Acidisphaera sp.]|nr:GNAT family N-acetyltransferase [Acidisphaera sp.]